TRRTSRAAGRPEATPHPSVACSPRTQQRATPTPPTGSHRSHPRTTRVTGVLGATGSKAGRSRCSTLEHHPARVRAGGGPAHHPPPMTGRRRCQLLLRKEVIQPHLPVRLPCYDLVPI